ncbi:MAG: hypothetical protein GC153_12660 [Alphaproteobacteria bacterium]|nr:hypothetical protein [Alphaproteobacteria bacterium]
MTSPEFAGWLLDTTIAVSGLILIVLILRKPVRRRFGAQAAYLLWLAPFLRLMLPDLPVLPPPHDAAVWIAATSLPPADAGASEPGDPAVMTLRR